MRPPKAVRLPSTTHQAGSKAASGKAARTPACIASVFGSLVKSVTGRVGVEHMQERTKARTSFVVAAVIGSLMAVVWFVMLHRRSDPQNESFRPLRRY
jgi:hypothetical protein